MTKVEKANKINQIAENICIPDGGDRTDLIDKVSDYYIRDMLHIEPSDDNTSINERNRKGINALFLTEAICYAVNDYDSTRFNDQTLLQYVGYVIYHTPRRSDIFPRSFDGKILDPTDKRAEPIKQYYQILEFCRRAGIDISMMSEDEISEICNSMNLSREKLMTILRAGSLYHSFSMSISFNEDDDFEPHIVSHYEPNLETEYKIWLMSWFVWLAREGEKKKQYIYEMINTNWVLNKAFFVEEFPDHTNIEYFDYAINEIADFIDATIIRYLNSINNSMSKQNFTPTYRKPYDNHLKEYALKIAKTDPFGNVPKTDDDSV
ncbi:MAG: hypothetical protein FWG88_11825 [Oscillospiraceae bacterium]|nr:hypothetical protein [Oscillospiraceae bacterium]